MGSPLSRPDPTSPASVAEAGFSTSRRGFNADEVRGAYQQKLSGFLQRWHDSCLSLGVDHVVVNTSSPVPQVLRNFLTSRSLRG